MLSREQVQFWNDNGYLLVKGIITKEEAANYRKECHDLAQRLTAIRDINAIWGSAAALSEESAKTVIQHCHDPQFYSAAFSKLIMDDRFTAACSELMDTPNVQLHHVKMFIKPPERGAPFPMHQDWPYFPHRDDSMIAAIFHFDDSTEEKGCVRVVPGSHKRGRIEHSVEGGWHLKDYVQEESTTCIAEPGDALFFRYLTIHGSGINVSDEARTTTLVQVRNPADCPEIDTHNSWGQGMMLRGIDPTNANGLTWMRTK